MHEIPFLHDIVVLFGSALAILALCNRFKIPAIIGFLITGILTGPAGLGWIKDTGNIQIFSEFGVIFLLFIIGLELHFERLKKLLKPMLAGGGIQAALTLASLTMLGVWKFNAGTGLFWGMILTLSSTAIVLKLYQDRNELETPHGSTSLGILLFQDFLIVPFILIVPILSGSLNASGLQIALRFGGGLVLIGMILILGKYVLPYLLHLIVMTRVRELLVLGALFICLGAAKLTESIGFSLALGAFLAGILISETDYHYQIESEITPFRDVFNSIFFISIGMMIDIRFFMDQWAVVLGLTGGVILFKFMILFLTVTVFSIPIRSKILISSGLAQIGEFSFILLYSGFGYKLIPWFQYQLGMTVIVMTMLFTPLLITITPRLFRPGQGRTNPETGSPELSGHIIIAGYGLTGRQLTRVLSASGLAYIVTEINGLTVKEQRKSNINIIFGDSTKRNILEKCNISRASCMVIVISDPYAMRQTIKVARSMNPNLYILARSSRLDEIQELQQNGANTVIAQEFESSIEIMTHMLERLHIPQNIIRLQAKMLRDDGYEMLRRPAATHGISDKILKLLAEGTTTTFMLLEEHAAVSRNIRELDLRKQTGATILAVMRGEQANKNPSPEFILQAGDILVLTGSHAEIDHAFNFLEKGGSTT